MSRRAFISARLRRFTAERARHRCEYGWLQQELCPESFEVDHIIPPAFGGPTKAHNLCFACPVCNNAKRNRVMARDPVGGRWVRLFHPRLQIWNDHFRWSKDSGTIVGRTATGRATVLALRMNHARTKTRSASRIASPVVGSTCRNSDQKFRRCPRCPSSGSRQSEQCSSG